ncbi:MAG: hypothetical protein SGBAC_008026 [Bacillariaceae sp.]
MAKEDVDLDSPKATTSQKVATASKDRAAVSPESPQQEMEGHEGSVKGENGKKTSSSKSSKSSSSKSKKDKDKSKKDKKDKKDRSSKDKERSSGGSSSRDRSKGLKGEEEKLASPKPKREGSQRSFKSPRSSRRKGRSKHSKKGVYFNKSVYVNTIPNLETFKRKEIDAVWFTPDDYAAMEQECDETAVTLDANRPLSASQCPRGLEAWTTDGELNKEANVQEAIENVWQAQLEQWQMAQDTNECWEFIRGEYLPTSARCIQDAHQTALKDEEAIQPYLNTTRQVFSQFARRVLGKAGGSRKIVRRTGNDLSSTPKTANRRTLGSRQSSSRSVSSNARSTTSSRDASLKLSQLAINGTLKSSLKASNVFIHDDSTIEEDGSIISGSQRSSSGSRKVARRPIRSSNATTNTDSSDIKSVGSLSYASTIESSASAAVSVGSGSRKISFKAKSKTKIPTSPVGSVADGSMMDESTNSRRMRSHMSVASDDSTRRRMRKVLAKPLL